MPLGTGLLRLLVLLLLLLLQDGLHLLPVQTIRLVLKFGRPALFHEVFHHVTDFFHEEGHRPFEKVHALGQVEWVHYVFVLFNVHFVVFDEDHGAFVLVFTAIIGRAEDCNDRREGLVPAPPMHLIAINLHLMRSNH